MENRFDYTDQNRIIAKILNLYYIENRNQAEIAEKLGLSAAKVNRLLKTARQAGLVEINIRLPFNNLFDLETRISALSGMADVIVTPSIDNEPGGDLSLLARVAARHLVSLVQSRDRICIGGGQTLSEIINQIEPKKLSGVRVYPAIGGVPRNVTGEVNGLATRLAHKLSGEAILFYAPAFAETEAERDTILGLTHVMRSLEQAREARIGLFGIGGMQMDSSIYRYCPLPYHEVAELVEKRNGVGEILLHAIDNQGRACVPELSNRVIGISSDDFCNIPVRIGVAGGELKAAAIAAAIKGQYFTCLIIDENAALPVLAILESEPVPNQVI